MEALYKDIYYEIVYLFHGDEPDNIAEVEERINKLLSYNSLHFYFLLTREQGIHVFCFITRGGDTYPHQESFYDSENTDFYEFLKVAKCGSLKISKSTDYNDLIHFLKSGNTSKFKQINIYLKKSIYKRAAKCLQNIAFIVSSQTLDSRKFIKSLYYFDLETENEDLLAEQESIFEQLDKKGLTLHDDATLEQTAPALWLISDGDKRYFITPNKHNFSYSVWSGTNFFHKMGVPDIQKIIDLSVSLEKALTDFFAVTMHAEIKFLFAHDESKSRKIKQVHLLFDDEILDLEHRTPPFIDHAFLEILNQYAGHLDSLAIRNDVTRFEFLVFALEMHTPEFIHQSQMRNISINPIRLGIVDLESNIRQATKEFDQQLNKLRKQLEQAQAEQRKIKKQRELEEQMRNARKEVVDLRARCDELEQSKRLIELNYEELKIESSKDSERIKNLIRDTERLQQRIRDLESDSSSKPGEKIADVKIQTLEDIKNLAAKHNMSEEMVINQLDNTTFIEYFDNKVDNKGPDKLSDMVFKSKKIISVFEDCRRKGMIKVCNYIESHSQNINPFVKNSAALACAEEIAKNNPPRIPGYAHESIFVASTNPGGNGLLHYQSGLNNLMMGFFSLKGDGLENSLRMASIRIMFENICSNLGEGNGSLTEILCDIQRQFLDSKFPNAAAMIASLDFLNNTLTYVRAAFPYVYVYNREQAQGYVEKCSGLPRLGFSLDEFWYQRPAKKLSLQSQDIVLMGTRDFSRILTHKDTPTQLMTSSSLSEILQYLSDRIKRSDKSSKILNNDIYLFALEVLP